MCDVSGFSCCLCCCRWDYAAVVEECEASADECATVAVVVSAWDLCSAF